MIKDYHQGRYHFKDDTDILHREDGPAIEFKDGIRMWYRNGSLHREDGPAIIWHNNTIEYFVKGVRHRSDGPAIQHLNGMHKQYFLEGKELSKEEYERTTTCTTLSTIP